MQSSAMWWTLWQWCWVEVHLTVCMWGSDENLYIYRLNCRLEIKSTFKYLVLLQRAVQDQFVLWFYSCETNLQTEINQRQISDSEGGFFHLYTISVEEPRNQLQTHLHRSFQPNIWFGFGFGSVSPLSFSCSQQLCATCSALNNRQSAMTWRIL